MSRLPRFFSKDEEVTTFTHTVEIEIDVKDVFEYLSDDDLKTELLNRESDGALDVEAWANKLLEAYTQDVKPTDGLSPDQVSRLHKAAAEFIYAAIGRIL
jgi:hypothetical protein